MTNEEVVQNSDKAVTECTKVVSAKGNPNKNPTTTPQLKPEKTFDTSKYNNSSAMVVPYDLMQQRRTVNFLSQMEARSMIPIQVRRENPPTVATLMEWASSLQLGSLWI